MIRLGFLSLVLALLLSVAEISELHFRSNSAQQCLNRRDGRKPLVKHGPEVFVRLDPRNLTMYKDHRRTGQKQQQRRRCRDDDDN